MAVRYLQLQIHKDIHHCTRTKFWNIECSKLAEQTAIRRARINRNLFIRYHTKWETKVTLLLKHDLTFWVMIFYLPPFKTVFFRWVWNFNRVYDETSFVLVEVSRAVGHLESIVCLHKKKLFGISLKRHCSQWWEMDESRLLASPSPSQSHEPELKIFKSWLTEPESKLWA